MKKVRPGSRVKWAEPRARAPHTRYGAAPGLMPRLPWRPGPKSVEGYGAMSTLFMGGEGSADEMPIE